VPSFATRTVTSVLDERRGLQRVLLDDASRAYVLTDLIGPAAAGDRVVVNTTAVDLGLGTGGWHVVHWNLAREAWSQEGPGHIMKLRYTSLQTDTGVAEEDYASELAGVPDLAGCPVVACGLHSQVACVAVVVKHLRPAARVVYVMTEAAALPLAFSDLVADLAGRHLLDVTVTAGQAFGGDLEAVNLPSALAVAAVVGQADVVVVAPGPGVVGTGTSLGASALELAAVVDMAGALGGTPIVALRYSGVDQRPRHRGVSRQTLTALGLAHRRAILAVPAGDLGDAVRAGLAGVDAQHAVAEVDVPDVDKLLAGAGLTVTTMGRSASDDPAFFAVAGAAGVAAVRAIEVAGRDGTLP
jgi:hypothetical protein